MSCGRLARPHDGILGYVPGVAGMHDVADYPGARQVPGLMVYRYDAPLCFANAEDFRRRALAAAASAPSALRWRGIASPTGSSTLSTMPPIRRTPSITKATGNASVSNSTIMTAQLG